MHIKLRRAGISRGAWRDDRTKRDQCWRANFLKPPKIWRKLKPCKKNGGYKQPIVQRNYFRRVRERKCASRGAANFRSARHNYEAISSRINSISSSLGLAGASRINISPSGRANCAKLSRTPAKTARGRARTESPTRVKFMLREATVLEKALFPLYDGAKWETAARRRSSVTRGSARAQHVLRDNCNIRENITDVVARSKFPFSVGILVAAKLTLLPILC